MGELPEDRPGWRALLRRVARATRDPMRAEDHLHTAFLRLTEYAKKHAVENPTAFLVRTAVNVSIDARRQYDNRMDIRLPVLDMLDLADDHPLQDEVIAARRRLDLVERLLSQLSPRTRRIFLMHRVEGLKYREIASELGITVSAVEKHVARAAMHLIEHAED